MCGKLRRRLGGWVGVGVDASVVVFGGEQAERMWAATVLGLSVFFMVHSSTCGCAKLAQLILIAVLVYPYIVTPHTPSHTHTTTNTAQAAEIATVFSAYDADDNGVLSLDEFQKLWWAELPPGGLLAGGCTSSQPALLPIGCSCPQCQARPQSAVSPVSIPPAAQSLLPS
jgi:hypothetical protein